MAILAVTAVALAAASSDRHHVRDSIHRFQDTPTTVEPTTTPAPPPLLRVVWNQTVGPNAGRYSFRILTTDNGAKALVAFDLGWSGVKANVTAYSAADGTTLWSTPLQEFPNVSGERLLVASSDSHVALVTHDGSLALLRPDNTVVWSLKLDEGITQAGVQDLCVSDSESDADVSVVATTPTGLHIFRQGQWISSSRGAFGAECVISRFLKSVIATYASPNGSTTYVTALNLTQGGTVWNVEVPGAELTRASVNRDGVFIGVMASSNAFLLFARDGSVVDQQNPSDMVVDVAVGDSTLWYVSSLDMNFKALTQSEKQHRRSKVVAARARRGLSSRGGNAYPTVFAAYLGGTTLWSTMTDSTMTGAIYDSHSGVVGFATSFQLMLYNGMSGAWLGEVPKVQDYGMAERPAAAKGIFFFTGGMEFAQNYSAIAVAVPTA